jgi:hypothetical protein
VSAGEQGQPLKKAPGRGARTHPKPHAHPTRLDTPLPPTPSPDCLHFLSRQPTGFDQALLMSLVNKTTIDMKLNPENRVLNITTQAGCW